MIKKPFLNGFARVFACACLLLLCRYLSAPAYAIDVSVASPWIGEIAEFIGGNSVNVRYLAAWNMGGAVVPAAKPKAGEPIIALDAEEAASLRIKVDDPRLKLLYQKLLIQKEFRYSVFFDPAMLPFIAQSVMKILADADPERYGVYQRRLAEFQSRINSTVDIGRYLLEGTKMLDATGAAGALVRSAVPGAVRPPDHVWKTWLSGDTQAMHAAFSEASKRGWLILLDSWTPATVRSAAVAYDNRLTLPAPAKDQDYITYMHDIFIMISGRTKSTGTGRP